MTEYKTGNFHDIAECSARITALEAALQEIAGLQTIAGEDAMISMLMHHVEIARAALNKVRPSANDDG